MVITWQVREAIKLATVNAEGDYCLWNPFPKVVSIFRCNQQGVLL